MPPANRSLNVTREELYQLVWRSAVQTVSQQFGLSGRGLAKLCARHDIPVPPRGYWAKVHAGHTVPQPPLPPSPNQATEHITVRSAPRVDRPDQDGDREERPFFSAELEALSESIRSAPPVVVRTSLRGQHPSIRDVAEDVKRERDSRHPVFDRQPWTSPRYAPGLSQALERPVLLILDALARHAEAHGIDVQSVPHRGAAITGSLLGDDFDIYAYEPLRRVKHRDEPRDPWSSKWEYQHSGRLEVGVVVGYWPGRTWRGSPERLAERLDDVLPAVVLAVDDRLRVQADIVRERREAEERARQRAAREAAVRAELQRRTDLLEESALWRDVVNAREYVTAVDEALATTVSAGGSARHHVEWVKWARSTLDRMDPVLQRLRAATMAQTCDADPGWSEADGRE